MKFLWNGGEWYIDKILANILTSLVYNVKSDWDFVIIISGDRGVRVGKSVLGMTVGAYLSYLLDKLKLNTNAFNMEHMIFDSANLMRTAQACSPYSVIQYDEGREGLAASKAMKTFQQDLVDFFTECGQLNHIFIIVLPDFFDLKESIAVGRSELLLNVYRRESKVMRDVLKTGVEMPIVRFDRGYFELFNRKGKQLLFDIARSKHQKNYRLIKPSIPPGRFTNQYPLGEEEYKIKKKESLARFAERKKNEKAELGDEYRPRHMNMLHDLIEKYKIGKTEIMKQCDGSDAVYTWHMKHKKKKREEEHKLELEMEELELKNKTEPKEETTDIEMPTKKELNLSMEKLRVA